MHAPLLDSFITPNGTDKWDFLRAQQRKAIEKLRGSKYIHITEQQWERLEQQVGRPVRRDEVQQLIEDLILGKMDVRRKVEVRPAKLPAPVKVKVEEPAIPTADLLLTPKHLAQIYGKDVGYIYNRIRKGVLVSERRGSLHLIWTSIARRYARLEGLAWNENV